METDRKVYDARYRQRHRERVRGQYKRWRERNLLLARERARATQQKRKKKVKEWRKNNAESLNRYFSEYSKKHPEMRRAYKAVQRALKSGKLIRPDHCPSCGVLCKPHAHHHNGYSVEHHLDVMWLCQPCHLFNHRKVA